MSPPFDLEEEQDQYADIAKYGGKVVKPPLESHGYVGGMGLPTAQSPSAVYPETPIDYGDLEQFGGKIVTPAPTPAPGAPAGVDYSDLEQFGGKIVRLPPVVVPEERQFTTSVGPQGNLDDRQFTSNVRVTPPDAATRADIAGLPPPLPPAPKLPVPRPIQAIPPPAVAEETAPPRTPTTISAQGLTALKDREGGFYEAPYQDSGTGLAIGYGMHTWQGKPVVKGMRITEAQADAELTRQIERERVPMIRDALQVPITQPQFDALVSVAWNHPETARRIVAKMNAGEAVTPQDFQWSATVKGKPNAGLASRRGEEYTQFTTTIPPSGTIAPLPAPAEPPVDQTKWDARPDGSKKGLGFLGLFKVPGTQDVASEYSIADSEQLKDDKGNYLDYPTLVPTLTHDEVLQVLEAAKQHTPVPPAVAQKAEAFALARKAAGKPLFAQAGEQQDLYPDLARATVAAPPVVGAHPEARIGAAPPPAPMPQRLGSAKTGPLTGQGARTFAPGTSIVAEGITQIGQGLENLPHTSTTSDEWPRVVHASTAAETEQTYRALADVLNGAGKAATPLAVVGAVLALPETVATVGATWLASSAVQKAAAYANATPGQQAFFSALAGTVVALGGTGRTLEVLQRAGRAAASVVPEAAVGAVSSTTRAAVLSAQLAGKPFSEAGPGVARAVTPGYHAPIEVLDVGPSGGYTPETRVGETLTDVLKTAVAPEPPPLQVGQGRDRMVPATPGETAPVTPAPAAPVGLGAIRLGDTRLGQPATPQDVDRHIAVLATAVQNGELQPFTPAHVAAFKALEAAGVQPPEIAARIRAVLPPIAPTPLSFDPQTGQPQVPVNQHLATLATAPVGASGRYTAEQWAAFQALRGAGLSPQEIAQRLTAYRALQEGAPDATEVGQQPQDDLGEHPPGGGGGQTATAGGGDRAVEQPPAPVPVAQEVTKAPPTAADREKNRAAAAAMTDAEADAAIAAQTAASKRYIEGLPDYAARAVIETSMGRRTNEGGTAFAPDPYAGGRFVEQDVPIATILANPRNKNLGTEAFTHRGSQTTGAIVIDDRGEVIDGNNRTHEAIARGETTIRAYVFTPPSQEVAPTPAAAPAAVPAVAPADQWAFNEGIKAGDRVRYDWKGEPRIGIVTDPGPLGGQVRIKQTNGTFIDVAPASVKVLPAPTSAPAAPTEAEQRQASLRAMSDADLALLAQSPRFGTVATAEIERRKTAAPAAPADDGKGYLRTLSDEDLKLMAARGTKQARQLASEVLAERKPAPAPAAAPETPDAQKPSLRVGDRVDVAEGPGEILQVDTKKGVARVAVDPGAVKLWIPLGRVQIAEAPAVPRLTREEGTQHFIDTYTPEHYARLAGYFRNQNLTPPLFEDVRDGYAQYLREAEPREQTVQDYAGDLAAGHAIARMYLEHARQGAPAVPAPTPTEGRKIEETTNAPVHAPPPDQTGAPAPERPTGGGSVSPGGPAGTGPRAQPRVESGPGAGDSGSGTVPGTDLAPAGKRRGVVDPAVAPDLYRITDADQIGTGTPKERVARNLAAIRIVKQLETEKRPATPEERATLVKYVGWGGLPRIFEHWKYDEGDSRDDQYWRDQYQALQSLLTEDEYADARNSTQNAHYTSPVVIRAIWDAVQRLGVTSGSVLEPSSGIGHFLGLAPDAIRALPFALVEKDGITAAIAKALYPGAYVQHTPYELASLPAKHFSLGVSNIPFGDIPITDDTIAPVVRSRIHNYFPAKQLDHVAPGGLVAFVTTHGSLDSRDNQKVREYYARHADFLGAIRLPWTAFKANANTEVVTDIVFLRKRHEGETPKHVAPWIESKQVDLPNKEGERHPQWVNEYFVAHPEMVLGTSDSTGKQRQANQYNVSPPGEKPAEQMAHWAEHGAQQLAAAVAKLPKHVIKLQPPKESLKAFTQAQAPVGSRPFEYLIHEGRLAQVDTAGRAEPVQMSGEDEKRIRAMLPMRTALRAVYDLLASDTATDSAVQTAQEALTKAYDAFVKKHGPISESKNWEAFREDPDLALILSLEEEYDAETGVVTKAHIFTTRTRTTEQRARTADSPAHALQLSLAETGRIDLDRIGELLKLTPEQAAEKLEQEHLIILTPTGWQTPDLYLSGNVRVKLTEAEAAAKLDSVYDNAVTALKKAIPETIPAHKIELRLGVPWVSAEGVQQFVDQITTGHGKWTVGYTPANGKWSIDGKASGRTSSFETNDVDTKTLLLDAMNDKRRVIKKTVGNGDDKRTVVDHASTALARRQRDAIHKAFARWLLKENPPRRDAAVEAFNDRYNAYVRPRVDGSHQTFPGMAAYWRQRISPHQRDAVARIVQMGNTLLAHVVGAGKTLAMVAGMMEMKRLGLARKPMMVVPNHLIAQAPGQFVSYYPNARVLTVTGDDLSKENRQRITARIAAGEWDAVIIPYSAFVRLSMSLEAEQAYQRELKAEIEAAIIQAYWDEFGASGASGTEGGGRKRKPPTIKNLEAMRDRIDVKLQKLAARPKDDMLTFEQLGVDALFVDEAHGFKNLYFPTRQQVAGIPANSDVQRATDLYLKTRYINKLSNYRNIVLATGTPVSNSMAEIYVMQKLLQEHALERAGVASFDAWLAQFGNIVTETAVDASGTGMSAKPRLKRFRNLASLAEMFRQVTDVQMIDDLPDLKARRPPLKGGAVEIVEIPPSAAQLALLEQLDFRAEHLDPKNKKADNMPMITTDGRMGMLDMRLLDRRSPEDPHNKISHVAEKVAAIYRAEHHRKGTQSIFMDSGVPGADVKVPWKWDRDADGKKVKRPLTEKEQHRGYDLYADLKQKLVRLGIPPQEIAFIQDLSKVSEQKRDAARDALFKKVQHGTIRVLLGSSGTMGTGMNVQDRLVALHNVDPTWKPSEYEQRNGRILRPGNLFATKDSPLYDPDFAVRILNYVTTGKDNAFGFDAYMWQLNEDKAKTIADFFNGTITASERTDMDLEQTVLTAGQLKAIATGNPRMIELGKAKGRLTELELAREGFDDAQREAEYNVDTYRGVAAEEIRQTERRNATSAAIEPYEAGTPLTATINEETLEGHKVIGDAILKAAEQATKVTAASPGHWSSYTKPVDLGTILGLTARLEGNTNDPYLTLRHPKDRVPSYGGFSEAEQKSHPYVMLDIKLLVPDPDGPGGQGWRNPTALMNAVVTRTQNLREPYVGSTWAQDRVNQYEAVLAQTFDEQAALDEARDTVARLSKELGLAATPGATPEEEEEIGEGDEEGDGEEGDVIAPTPAAARVSAAQTEASSKGFAPPQAPTPATMPGQPGTPVVPLGGPELVELVRELTGLPPKVVRKFAGDPKHGTFNPGTGIIRLGAHLFQKGMEHQLLATISHEIGHLADWLPHYTMKRGNLIGRLLSLRNFRKHVVTTTTGGTIENKVIKKELQAVSDAWRPWNPALVPASFAAYRRSAKELYADAISVLLNDPGRLQHEAPTFYKEFFAALDQKPEVKAHYQALQQIMLATPEERTAHRRANVVAGYARADVKAQAGEKKKLADRKLGLTASQWWLQMREGVFAKNARIRDLVAELEKRGIRIHPDYDPRYMYEERNYLGGLLAGIVKTEFLPIVNEVLGAGIPWSTFGEMLQYERITAGDRMEIANPGNWDPVVAQEGIDQIQQQLTPSQWATLQQQLDAFRAVTAKYVTEAHRVGLIGAQSFHEMRKNPKYATYRNVDYIDDADVSWRIFRQTGMLGDTQNPADATMHKVLATARAIDRQKMRVGHFDFLHGYAPTEIKQAKEVYDGVKRKNVPVEPAAEEKKDWTLVTYYEDGRLRGKWVKPNVADMIHNLSVGHNWAVIRLLREMNSGWLRPIFTTFNLGFQSYNLIKDFGRAYRTMPGLSPLRPLKRYKQAHHLARARGFGLPDNPTAKQLQGWHDLNEAEKARILGVTLNDQLTRRRVEDTVLEDTLSKYQAGGFRHAAAPRWQHELRAVAQWIENTGNYVETLPKAAAMYEFRGQGTISEIPPDVRSFIRKGPGSPDFLEGGWLKPITNEFFLFSNAATQALRVDLDLLAHERILSTRSGGPSGAGGGWTPPPQGQATGLKRFESRSEYLYKLVLAGVLPKVLQAAVMFWLGKAVLPDAWQNRLKKMYRGISEYYLTQYNVIPYGFDSRGKVLFFSWPQDELDRLVGAITWKLLRLTAGNKDVWATMGDVFSFIFGQAPQATPPWRILTTDLPDMISGLNIYDPFRGQMLYSQTEMDAREWNRWGKFAGHVFMNLGGGIVYRWDQDHRPREKSAWETFLGRPIVSNTIGRFFKVGSAEDDALRAAADPVRQQEARDRLAEYRAVDTAIASLYQLPAAERTRARRLEAARAVMKELHPDSATALAGANVDDPAQTDPDAVVAPNTPAQRQRQFHDVFKKINMGAIKGSSDALTEAIMGVTSPAQKVAVLTQAASDLSEGELQEWMRRAMQNKVLSPQVRAAFIRSQRAREPAAAAR